jgi:hypothetical protein
LAILVEELAAIVCYLRELARKDCLVPRSFVGTRLRTGYLVAPSDGVWHRRAHGFWSQVGRTRQLRKRNESPLRGAPKRWRLDILRTVSRHGERIRG